MRVGIFGGTFNPIHIGHIRGAISAYEAFKLDKIIFMPTGIPPHKKDDVAPAEYRYQMVQLAISDIDYLQVSRMEIDSNRVNYTIDTILELKQAYNSDELFFIVGTDAFFYLDLWKDYKKLIKLVSFILMRRPEYDIKPIIKKYESIIEFLNIEDSFKKDNNDTSIYIYTPPAFDISSSMVRKKIKEGKTVTYIIPEKVEKFIKEKGLYKL